MTDEDWPWGDDPQGWVDELHQKAVKAAESRVDTSQLVIGADYRANASGRVVKLLRVDGGIAAVEFHPCVPPWECSVENFVKGFSPIR